MKYLLSILFFFTTFISCSTTEDKSIFHQNRTRAEVSRSEEMAHNSADNTESIKKELEQIKKLNAELNKTQASISQKGTKCR